MTEPARISYDPKVDSATVWLREGPVRSATQDHLDERRVVDRDSAGEPVAIELHHVSLGVDLRGLPERDRVMLALERLAGERGWELGVTIGVGGSGAALA